MVHHNLSQVKMSENIEMYLLKIVLLQKGKQPVPVPLLANELSVSPVSANEMCRKLAERELIRYEPYKGVILTSEGEELARRILHCRRLWEVFLVEKLGLDIQEAEEVACRFEHVTPDKLAAQLADFLDNPTFSPQNEPILYTDNYLSGQPSRPLSSFVAGERGQIVNIGCDEITRAFLRKQGIVAGVFVEVLAVAEGVLLLLETSNKRISVSGLVAEGIDVINI